MTIQELQNAKLSSTTAGYLAIYLKLSDLYDEIWDVANKQYENGNVASCACEDFYKALTKAQNEAMRLAKWSIIGNINDINNSAEL